MILNVLIGGAAGQGIDTTAAIFEKLLKLSGYSVFTCHDFMSRVRGGHNFILLRFGDEPVTSHNNQLDGLVALNEESVQLHLNQLRQNGFILGDRSLPLTDSRWIPLDMQKIAKDLGNPRVSGSVAVGALAGLFGIAPDQAKTVLAAFVKAELVDINLQAFEAGYKSVKQHFTIQPGANSAHISKEQLLLSGNQAIALGAIAAGVRFYSAYPMSPSTSILEFLAAKGTAAGIVAEQAEDEIAAINMAIGASYAGVRAMTGTSGGGFSLMVEALGLAGITEIPLVVANIQRPGPATGLPTRTEQSDLKFVISAAQGEFPRFVISVRHPADAFYQTIRAFRLADQYQIPVILLSDQYLADSSTTVDPFVLDGTEWQRPLPAQLTKTPDEPFLSYRLTDDGVSPRAFPNNSNHFLVAADSDEHDEQGRITESAEVRTQMTDKRLRKLANLQRELQEPELLGAADCKTLLVGWGSLYGPLADAITRLAKTDPGQFSALVFGDIFPLPVQRIQAMATTAGRIINVEQNATGQLAGLLREYANVQCQASLLKYDGRQWTGEEIAAKVKEVKQNG
jgi:2-oxoglutarate ferredoxin oxidoreductase subunit alpha